MKYYSIILILFLFSCKYSGHVKRVIDGDSFYLDNGKEIRLAECDAPENTRGHNQDFGNVATEFTRQYLEGKTVILKNVATDKYGRKVCEVWVNGIWFNEQLVKQGLAWTSSRYSCLELQKDELTAKENKIGLWIDPNAINPYIFRKHEK